MPDRKFEDTNTSQDEAQSVNHISFPPAKPMRIAVVGTGIAGLSAAWLLAQRHHVTVYEKNTWVGGHSHTVDAPTDRGPTPVDTGFIVYNERSYPNLVALFDHLSVPTKPSDMSFAASLRDGAFEYAGTDLNGLFGQRRNVLRPDFWRMMVDLMRFYREAPKFLKDPASVDMSLGEYLRANDYSKSFIENHLLPMGAAIWSTTAPEMEAYPARAFIRFFESHGLLLLKDRPQWRTVHGGSRQYVVRLIETFRDGIRLGGVRRIKRSPNKVVVEEASGRHEIFDHVVIATHADQAYGLLADPDQRESELLAGWRYSDNRAVLHSDPALMPKRERVWSSWNFIDRTDSAGGNRLCVTYWMNKLQSINPATPLFVTLNPAREPAADKFIREIDYTHPYFDQWALASQKRLWSLQGRRRTWFCGSYFGYGFHEDALQSGLAVAEQLGGVRRPWSVPEESGRIQVSAQAEPVAA
jgi:predicted NAD/FAD-binding protein